MPFSCTSRFDISSVYTSRLGRSGRGEVVFVYTASVRVRGRSFRPSEWGGPKRLRLRPTQSPRANLKKHQRRTRRTAKLARLTWPVKRATLVPQGLQEVALRSGMEGQRRLPWTPPSRTPQQGVSLRRPAPGWRRECHNRRGMMRQRRGECYRRRMAARSSARGSGKKQRRGRMTIRRHHHRRSRSARHRHQSKDCLKDWLPTRIVGMRIPMRMCLRMAPSAPG